MFDFKAKCLELVPEYNKGRGKVGKISKDFVLTWDDYMCKDWLYNHFHIDFESGKTFSISEIETKNLELIQGMEFTDVIVGFSGGKDSVAAAVKTCELFSGTNIKIHIVFSDTGNESQITYDYIDLISRGLTEKYGVGITTVYPKRDFMTLVRHKGMFPVSKRRFCTDHLKLRPLKLYRDKVLIKSYASNLGWDLDDEYIESLLNKEDIVDNARKSHSVLMCQGTRRSESLPRRYVTQFKFDADWHSWQFRPLCYEEDLHSIFEYAFKVASMNDVIDIYKANRPKDEAAYKWGLERVIDFGYPANPHYALGFTRLGCAPCFMSRKLNVRLISMFFPDKVDEIREVEKEIDSTFFYRSKVPDRFHDHEWVSEKGKVWTVPTIDAVITWSKTKRYTRNSDVELDLFANIPKPTSRSENLRRKESNCDVDQAQRNENNESLTCSTFDVLCE